MIKIINARTNNLKNINLEIPKNCINVITGVSGSGKTSLAFDTIFVEGQRKYFELLSYSIKGNLPKYPKADVDTITGLTPVCSLKKSTRLNSNSTVGTLSEIIHYLRLMFARIGSVFCPDHNIKLESKSLGFIPNPAYLSAITGIKTGKRWSLICNDKLFVCECDGDLVGFCLASFGHKHTNVMTRQGKIAQICLLPLTNIDLIKVT